MEISVLGGGFKQVITRLSPLPSLSSPSSPLPSTTRAKCSHLTSATPPLHKESQIEPTHVSVTPRKRYHSVAYKARQSAILEVQQSSDLGSALARLGDMLKVQDLNVILRHFGKLCRWQDLSQLFDWMQKHEKITFSSYSTYIKFMGKSLNPIKALEIYNSIQDESVRNNVSVCNSVLSCLIRNGKFENSLKLFHQMKQDGLRPDAVTYSTLLAGCMKVKHGYSKALELVQEMERSRLPMDSVIYGTLLAVCASNNRCKEAENYFNQMKDEGHLPNVFHYSSLLNAYSAEGDYKKADMLVQDMKSAGLVPNKVILTTLLKVYVRGGLFEKSRELLAELEDLGYAEDEMPYCLLMDGLAKSRRILEAKSIFEEMKKKQVKSDGYCYSIMISAFCRGGLLKEAKQLARDFEATYDKYDLVMLNTMLCAYCRAGEMESVMQMMRKMDELAISPDWNTFHILIKYFCKEKLYLLAYRTMEDMHNKGHQPEEELCSSLISHLGKIRAHSQAFSVYNMLRYSKRTMCKALHEKILHILVAGRLLKDAYVVVKELFQMAVTRYIAEPEKKELLLHLLQWMPGQGYVVDSSTRNMILKNSHLFGRQLIAEMLSKQHARAKALISN